MLIDRYQGKHASESSAAVTAYEEAVAAVAAHRPAGDALQRSLAADPDFLSAYALAGFGAVMLARSDTLAAAEVACKQAVNRMARRKSVTVSEKALVEALQFAVRGRISRAAERLELHLQTHPYEFLCAKITHALRFMFGDQKGMLHLTSSLLPRLSPDAGGYGFLMGCHAFGLEEAGAYQEAEIAGKQAVMYEPADSWGLHAVSHVYEMTGRIEAGCEWLTKSRPVWSRCNNFSYHMAWHLALLHLEKGDHDSVLSVYDEEVRPAQTDDFRDMANAVSMLWRLEQDGVDVANRWEELHEVARYRRTDVTYVFASLHYLLALIAAGDRCGAEDLLRAMRQHSLEGSDQARVAAIAGVPLAEAMLRLPRHCEKTGISLAETANRLPAIGGSHAQRDVFLRTLLILAQKSGDLACFKAISAMRQEMRHEDRFHREIFASWNRRRVEPIQAPHYSQQAQIGPLARLI